MAYACQQSYECGNMPFAVCRNKLNLFQGIGYESGANPKVIVMGKFNATQGPVGNSVIASIPVTGGELKTEYEILSDINVGSGYSTAFRLFAYLPDAKVPFIVASQRLAPATGPYNPANGVFSGIWYSRGYTLGAVFDETNQRAYFCDIGIKRLNSIPKSSDDVYPKAIDVYQQQRCNFLRLRGDDIYIVFVRYDTPALTESTVYRGSVNCQNCPADNLVKIVTVPYEVTDFAVDAGSIYLATKPLITQSSGIVQMAVANGGQPAATRQLTSDPTVSMVLGDGTIYYTTTTGLVKKVTTGIVPVVSSLYNPASSTGGCACAEGFTGAQCQTCEGTIRWLDGNPMCVPTLPSGHPSSCAFDVETFHLPIVMESADAEVHFMGISAIPVQVQSLGIMDTQLAILHNKQLNF
eukprot:gene10749-12517_t